jgi:hypothetical protein
MRAPTRLGSVAAMRTVTYNQAMATMYTGGARVSGRCDSSERGQ